MRTVLILLFLIVAIAGIAAAYRYNQNRNENEHFLVLYGNIDVRQVDLGFRVGGLVIDLPFQEGDFVKEGQRVAKLDPQPYLDQVREAEAQVEVARTTLKNTELVFKRRQELVGDGSVSQEDYTNSLSTRDVDIANLKAAEATLGVAKTNLQFTEVFAPADGVILTRIREPGSIVIVSEAVTILSLVSPVCVRAFVSERDLGRIYPGMPAEVYTDTKGGKVYKGQIGFISSVAEFTPKTVETTKLRTDLVYRLRIIADNPDKFLRQGMPVTVKLPLSQENK